MTVKVWIENFVKQVKSIVVKGNNKYNGLIKFELFYINASWVCYWVNPVSYTHLDVYKRQISVMVVIVETYLA